MKAGHFHPLVSNAGSKTHLNRHRPPFSAPGEHVLTTASQAHPPDKCQVNGATVTAHLIACRADTVSEFEISALPPEPSP